MSPALLAEEPMPTGLHYAHQWFNRSDPTILITIVSTFAAIGVVLILASFWQHIQELRLTPEKRQPMVLFRHLQKQLGLSYLERWRMWWLARQLELEHPATLLICETLFDESLTQAGYTQPTQAARLARFQRIRGKLFPA